MKLHSMSRRNVLQVLGGAALVPLIGCRDETTTSPGPDAAPATDTCEIIPTETGGPYPGDGTNGVNALAMTGIVRSDIRSSFGTATGIADGVLLTVTLAVVDVASICAPLAGRAVYIWHCDRAGDYSLYSPAVASENYLRGVQVTDANGQVTFTTIYPGCYSGRWPHIHMEVYASLADATLGSNAIKTSQIAMPADASQTVYASTGYEASITNLAQVSLATDMVFSDGATLETPAITGSVSEGFTIALALGV